MKAASTIRLRRLLPPMAGAILATTAAAADRWWDGGNANIGTPGNGASAGGAGTWNTSLTNWDQGNGLAHVAWNNANIDTAIFGGTTSNVTVTVGTGVTVNQLRFLTTGFTIGAAASGPITFGGSYGDTTPAIDASAVTGAGSATIGSKITGTIAGGLVIAHGGNITTPVSSGRVYLTSTSTSDFVGDITVVSGNLHILSNLGDAGNDIILKGGALYGSSGTGTTSYTSSRAIDVAANSGIGTRSDSGGTQNWTLSGAITGTGNLTRYNGTGTGLANVTLQGAMSGYSGTFENTGSNLAAEVTRSMLIVETTATSAGAWKLTGGTVRLNTTDDTHIAHGAGKSDLLMNGGTLDMNGKLETINGLSGATGIVQNQAATTASTLTLGAGDATADFGGTIRDNAGTGGTVALIKTGNGTQTLSGNSNSYTGATLVDAGTLLVTGQLGATAVTIDGDAALGGGGILSGALHFNAGADLVFSTTQTLTVNGASVTFDGFGIADLVGLDDTVATGIYTLIGGTAVVNPANLSNIGVGNYHPLGSNKFAFFEVSSLKVHVIPEPATALLGGLGLLALLRRRRRRP